MRIACLYASFMDEEAVERLGVEPLRPLLDAVDSLRDVRDLAAFLGEFEQIGGSGPFGVYVDVDGKNSDRSLFNVVQGGLGLPDESYYHDEKFAEIREKYVAFLTRMFELVEHADPAGAAATVMAVETRLVAGPLGARRDPRRPEDLQPADPRGAARAVPGLRLGGLHPQPRRLRGDHRRDLRPAAVLPRAPVRGARGGADRGLAHLAGRPRHPRRTRRTSPAEFVETNFDFYGRTLGGTPELRERWKRGVALVEGSIGEAVGREYVARHFPPDVQGDDGGAGRQPAARLPRSRSRRWTG